MHVKILFAAIVSIAIACNGRGSKVEEAPVAGNKAQEDSLYSAVMEGHDVGMAKMSKLKKSISQVQQALDSLGKLQASKIDTLYRRQLLTLQEDLNYAEVSMNTWMEEFVLDSAKDNSELRIKYLESEKAKVTKVRDNILNSLQRADSLLKR